MKKYKITTLGREFLLLCKGLDGVEDVKYSKTESLNLSSNRGTLIEIKTDFSYDYRILLPSDNRIFLPDIQRLLLIFLYGIKGFPRSEYEILSYENSKQILIPDFFGFYGGNVGKCKLLSSKNATFTSESSLEFYTIQAPDGNYIAVVCDNAASVDLKKILSSSIYDMTSGGKLRGAIALCVSENDVHFVSRDTDGGFEPRTSAYAVTCFLMNMLFSSPSNIVRTDNFCAKCECEDSCVSVYDLSPKIYTFP